MISGLRIGFKRLIICIILKILMSVPASMEDVVTTAQTYLAVTCAPVGKDTSWGQTMSPALISTSA